MYIRQIHAGFDQDAASLVTLSFGGKTFIAAVKNICDPISDITVDTNGGHRRDVNYAGPYCGRDESVLIRGRYLGVISK